MNVCARIYPLSRVFVPPHLTLSLCVLFRVTLKGKRIFTGCFHGKGFLTSPNFAQMPCVHFYVVLSFHLVWEGVEDLGYKSAVFAGLWPAWCPSFVYISPLKCLLKCHLFFFFFFVFLGPYPRHMEVPRLGVELEL